MLNIERGTEIEYDKIIEESEPVKETRKEVF